MGLSTRLDLILFLGVLLRRRTPSNNVTHCRAPFLGREPDVELPSASIAERLRSEAVSEGASKAVPAALASVLSLAGPQSAGGSKFGHGEPPC